MTGKTTAAISQSNTHNEFVVVGISGSADKLAYTGNLDSPADPCCQKSAMQHMYVEW